MFAVVWGCVSVGWVGVLGGWGGGGAAVGRVGVVQQNDSKGSTRCALPCISRPGAPKLPVCSRLCLKGTQLVTQSLLLYRLENTDAPLYKSKMLILTRACNPLCFHHALDHACRDPPLTLRPPPCSPSTAARSSTTWAGSCCCRQGSSRTLSVADQLMFLVCWHSRPERCDLGRKVCIQTHP